MAQKDILLETNNLKITFQQRYGLVTAVEDVSFQVKKGKIIGLVGESGCGKSVTCRSFLRIEAPGQLKAGEILFYPSNGKAVHIHKLDPKKNAIRSIRWKEIAMIFQEPMTSLGPMHTIGNQISEAIRLHTNSDKKEAMRLAIESLRSVGMPRAENIVRQYPHQMSGGMRQRAMIAMALSCNPNLLIADEPTTALDVTTEAQILELLNERRQALNMTILYITHNLAVISQIADKILVMYLGRIVEEASTEVLFNYPKHPYTKALLKSIPQIHSDSGEKLEAIEGDIPNPFTRPAGCTFHPRCSQSIAGVCNQTIPKMIQLKDSVRVACHLYT
jgi:oligopeptide/dipeptide ABC transporter ATP-binding protein